MDSEILDPHYEEVISIDLPHPPDSIHHNSSSDPHHYTLSNISHGLHNSHTLTLNHDLDINHQRPEHKQPSNQTATQITYGINFKEEVSLESNNHHVQQDHSEELIYTTTTSDTSNHQLANNHLTTSNSTSVTINSLVDSQTETIDDTNLSTKCKTRFKWSKEMSQVALRLVKHGYKPKIVSIAVGCSLRTAQKFVETVTPKIEGDSFKNFEIKRRGRQSKGVNERLQAIKDVLSKDVNKTQIEIAAQLNVSNTTVCRDIKRIGTSWKERVKKD